MVSAQLLEKDRAKIPKKVPFFFIYRGILLYNVRIVQWLLLFSFVNCFPKKYLSAVRLIFPSVDILDWPPTVKPNIMMT